MKKSHGLALSAAALVNFLMPMFAFNFYGDFTANIVVSVVTIFIIGNVIRRLNDGWVYPVGKSALEDLAMISSLVYILIGTLISIRWVQGEISTVFLMLYLIVVAITTIYFLNKSSAQQLVNETSK